MNVLYACNEAYVGYTGISINSLLCNNRELEELNIYILGYHFSEKSISQLMALGNQYGRRINIVKIDDIEQVLPSGIKEVGYPIVALARLLMPLYLPNDMQEVLYLDSDTIVNGTLHGLEDIHISETDYYLAAVPELNMPLEMRLDLGLLQSDTYYNAGVQLCNLRLWRQLSLPDRFIGFISERNGNLTYFDQDIMNYCCRGKILTLPYFYNICGNLPYFPIRTIRKLQPAYEIIEKKEHNAILKNPIIIHFLGDERPWIKGNFNYYRRYYERNKLGTCWEKIPQISGLEIYMFCYHVLNLITRICPIFRIEFTKYIGIKKYLLWGKK